VLDLFTPDVLVNRPRSDLAPAAVTAADFDGAAASQALVASVFKRVAHEDGRPYLPHQVERPPLPLDDNPEPEYPAALVQRHLEGRVVVEFVVDTMGIADLHTVRIIASAHPMFTRAVTAVVSHLRFPAGETGDRKVPVLVLLGFSFVVR
jgi:TonB family protein